MGGIIALAYPAQRSDLERATDLFRLFREQPTGDLARSARGALRTAVSPNERLQTLWHPWTSYAIVPLFALANAGVHLSGGFLATAYSSPVTLGILVGYVVGKPIGIVGSTLARDARSAAAACGRRSAGPRSPARGRSPASGSPSRS